MKQIREILQGDTALAAEALLVLRLRCETADAIATAADTHLRPSGYRLVGVFEYHSHAASSVVGLREMWSTAFGHYMYIDDLSTMETARGNGIRRRAAAVGRKPNVAGARRFTSTQVSTLIAHRLYMHKGLRISAHHFSIDVSSRLANPAAQPCLTS